MPETVDDPVVAVLRFGYRMIVECKLNDVEAALTAAAFSLYGPGYIYLPLAVEAIYFSRSSGGSQFNAIIDATRYRMERGTLGSMDTSVWRE